MCGREAQFAASFFTKEAGRANEPQTTLQPSHSLFPLLQSSTRQFAMVANYNRRMSAAVPPRQSALSKIDASTDEVKHKRAETKTTKQ
jgi:hypothetical protein